MRSHVCSGSGSPFLFIRNLCNAMKLKLLFDVALNEAYRFWNTSSLWKIVPSIAVRWIGWMNFWFCLHSNHLKLPFSIIIEGKSTVFVALLTMRRCELNIYRESALALAQSSRKMFIYLVQILKLHGLQRNVVDPTRFSFLSKNHI